jgi:hypothetical protein
VQKLNRFKYINLKVLETYAQRWPDVPMGLSDHTHGSLTVLGAVGLYNCCAVEKHFTLDNTQEGQDHAFSMTPASWKKMVEETENLQKELKAAGAQSFAERFKITRAAVDDPEALDFSIGTGVKQLEENEAGTVIVQRSRRLCLGLRLGQQPPQAFNLALQRSNLAAAAARRRIPTAYRLVVARGPQIVQEAEHDGVSTVPIRRPKFLKAIRPFDGQNSDSFFRIREQYDV